MTKEVKHCDCDIGSGIEPIRCLASVSWFPLHFFPFPFFPSASPRLCARSIPGTGCFKIRAESQRRGERYLSNRQFIRVFRLETSCRIASRSEACLTNERDIQINFGYRKPRYFTRHCVESGSWFSVCEVESSPFWLAGRSVC